MVPVSPPIPAFLRLLHEGASGVIWFRLRGREISVALHNGHVMQVSGLPELIRLQGHQVAESVNTGDMIRDIGTAVVGGVPANEALEAASVGLGRFLSRVVHEPESTAAWDEGVEPPSGAFPLPMPMLKALGSGLAEARTPMMAQTHWENRLSQKVKASPIGRDARATRGLNPVAARALNLAGDGRVFSEVVQRLIGGNPSRRQKTWWALDLLLESGLMVLLEPPPEEEKPDAGQQTKGKGGKAGGRADVDPGVVHMQRQYRKLLRMRPLEALEIVVEDPQGGLKVDAVREAFRRAAKKYHPDRFTGEQDAMQRAAALCFQVLGDYKSQMEEPELLEHELQRLCQEQLGRTHVREDDRIKAKVLYNKGNSYFRNRAYGAARDAFAEASTLDPDFKMALARYTHCKAVLKEMPYEEAYLALNELEAENVGEKIELLYLTAWLLKLLGREEEAMKQYKAILERNPEHREATRELRLWRKRAGDRKASNSRHSSKVGKSDAGTSGFFQSIRKRRGS